MFEMLSGAPPFTGDGVTEVLVKVIVEEAPPLRSRAPDVCPRLAAIVDRALAKNPNDRFESAIEMTAALRELLKPELLARAPIPRGPSLKKEAPATLVPASPTVDTLVEHAPPAPRTSPVALWIAIALSSCAILFAGVAAGTLFFEPKIEPAPQRAPVALLEPVDPEPILEPEPIIERTIEPYVPPEPRRQPATLVQRPVEPKPQSKNEPEPEPEPEPETVLEFAEEAPPATNQQRGLHQEPLPEPTPEPTPVKISSPDVSPSISSLKVDGGLAAKRCTEHLTRALPEARACLRAATETIEIRARIGTDGRLRQIQASAATACIEAAFSVVRLPRPDTGDAKLSFVLRGQ
jgi:serine/threonine protein kinase